MNEKEKKIAAVKFGTSDFLNPRVFSPRGIFFRAGAYFFDYFFDIEILS